MQNKLIKRNIFYKKLKFFIKRLFRPKFLYLLSKTNKPLSNLYGLERGDAIDRFYIEGFLENNKNNIQGKCLELLNNEYTRKFGVAVNKSDILDIDKNNTRANIIGDIKNLTSIQDNQYDCIILTQVLQFIDDVDQAIKECHRILKVNGVLLVTLPSVSRIDCMSGQDGDFWRFTEASANYIFSKHFNKERIEIKTCGNATICAKFILGFAQEEISKKELEYNDSSFPLLVTIKATK